MDFAENRKKYIAMVTNTYSLNSQLLSFDIKDLTF